MPEKNINKKININSELFFKYDKSKEINKDDVHKKINESYQFIKLKKKNEKKFFEFIYEDEDYKEYFDKDLKIIRVKANKDIKNMDLDEKDYEEENYYLKLYEKIKSRKQKWFEKLGDKKDFELKYRVFKEELERLRKLSKEDFLRDTLLFLQEDNEIDYSKKEN